MKLRTKIVLGFVIVAVIGWMLGGVGIWATERMSVYTQAQNDINTEYIGISQALVEHYAWWQSLSASAQRGVRFAGLDDPAKCALGIWLTQRAYTLDNPTVNALSAEILAPHEDMHTSARQYNQLIDTGRFDEARALAGEHMQPRMSETTLLIKDIQAEYARLLEAATQRVQNDQQAIVRAILLLVIAAAIASALFVYFIIISIMRPLRAMTQGAQSIAAGNLSFSLRYRADDEIGRLCRSFEAMADAMRRQADTLTAMADGDYTVLIDVRSPEDTVNTAINHLSTLNNDTLTDVRAAARQVSTAAQQVAGAAQTLAAGANQQAAAVDQLTAASTEIKITAEQNNAEAEQVLVELKHADDGIKAGEATLEQLNAAMRLISENAQRITQVVQMIEDIAFQTNILALNAAVEAAHAGVHGSGFAVVAEEVRRLAAQSAEGAKETARLVEESFSSVASGVEIVARANEQLRTISRVAGSNGQAIERMSVASQQQSTSMNELVKGVGQIAAVVQSNARMADETAAAAEEMAAQSDSVNAMVGRFRLRSK